MHIVSPEIRIVKAKEIEIRTRPRVRVHVDGEIFGTTSINIRVVPKVLSVVLPE